MRRGTAPRIDSNPSTTSRVVERSWCGSDACALVLQLYSIGLEGGTLSTARSTEMNCAETARRGLPSTVSVKSPAARSCR